MPRELPDFHVLIQAFLRNPDGPEGLALQSAINAAMQPRRHAVQMLTEALALQYASPGPQADAAVVVATCAYEAHVQPLDAVLWADFRDQARQLVHTRRCQPPAIESIVALQASPDDAEYAFAGTMGGIRGTWHRLWGTAVMEAMGLLHLPPSEPNEVLLQLEEQLGRDLTAEEIERLKSAAREHAAYLAGPDAREHLGPVLRGSAE